MFDNFSFSSKHAQELEKEPSLKRGEAIVTVPSLAHLPKTTENQESKTFELAIRSTIVWKEAQAERNGGVRGVVRVFKIRR